MAPDTTESTLADKSRPTPPAGPGKAPTPKPSAEDERRGREAEALRQNLLRRKEQQRSRKTTAKSSAGKP